MKEETRKANQREQERIQRIKERQKYYNEVAPTPQADTLQEERLILEINPKNKEVVVEVNKELVKCLKSHQVQGIKFMYDSTIESVFKLEDPEGTGCILAHSMGLGKTLQVITFLHTLLTNEKCKAHIQHALIICPLNTVKNWYHEFLFWLEQKDLLSFPLFDLNEAKTPNQRGETLKLWRNRGGVLITGINLFANIISKRGKKPPKWVQALSDEAFIDPGPDIVIVDEGHLLKNAQTITNKAVSNISTLRRIILTGTPLQNNLEEYHVMVHFVKPNLLGTKKEFTNRFVNPITNGQHIDSTPADVKLMKKRVHVLHKILDGCVQRFDYNVLMPYLQPKYEYVLSVQLTKKQIELYRYYLEHRTLTSSSCSLLNDFNNLKLIWNHPGLLYSNHAKKVKADIKKKEDNFVVTSSEDESIELKSDQDSSADEDEAKNNVLPKAWNTRSRAKNNPELVKLEDNFEELDDFYDAWFKDMISKNDRYNIELSGKMILLFAILEECEKIGDKIIIFSQSLDVLDLIEECLEKKSNEKNEQILDNYEEYTWIHGIDYFRIDGSVGGDSRKSHIDAFNNPENYRARLFLLSTKAGGLGVNLVGANRCIIFDASWNPTHDLQAIFRIYRFGQNKPVYVYRFVAQGSMEEKIYDRQVIKQSLSIRVIDELQVGRHFKASDLQELYRFTPDESTKRPTPILPKDKLFANLLISHKHLIVNYHEHDSLLKNTPDEDLTEEERKLAWQEYENEKEAQVQREKFEELQRQREEQYKLWQQQQAEAKAQAYAQAQQTEFYWKQELKKQEQKMKEALDALFSKSNVNNSASSSHANNNFVNHNQTFAKRLPPYELMTVEDVLNYLGDRLNISEKANEVYRILANGLTVANQGLVNLNNSKKVNESMT